MTGSSRAVLVFDPKLWNYKDEGDNSQFWKPATIVAYTADGTTATVRFHHDGRLSKGHFVSGFKEIP